MKTLIATLAILSTMAATPALAMGNVKIGTLDCTVDGGSGFVFGSSRNLACTFTPAFSNAPKETYTGRISKFGVDLGITGTTLIHWLVVAAADTTYSTGKLAGTYGGVTASASAPFGIGANVLVGGFKRSYALQPVSVQVQDGVNLAVGIAELRLSSGAPG